MPLSNIPHGRFIMSVSSLRGIAEGDDEAIASVCIKFFEFQKTLPANLAITNSRRKLIHLNFPFHLVRFFKTYIHLDNIFVN